MKRAVSRLCLALAVLGSVIDLALGLVGNVRGLELPPGRGSMLFVEAVAALASVLFVAVGRLISRAQPGNAIGWIFMGGAVVLAVTGAAYGYADLALYGGEPWPFADWAAWLASWLFIVPFFVGPCMTAQLFPDGRPLPGNWRSVLGISLACGTYIALAPALQPGVLGSYPTVGNPAGLPEPIGSLFVDPTWGLAIFALFGASLASIATRFRSSTGVERQQLRWLVFAGSFVIVGWLFAFAVDTLGGVWAVVFGAPALVAFGLIPVTVAFAILRYRLYEIDRIISKTLVYVALTVVLGAAYVGLVLAGQALFSSFAGGSNLAVATSTLVVAALFLPARARIQRIVDRRFYRRRYDAQRTLEAFGARLREELDLETLVEEFRAAVGETVEPAHASLWLRGPVA